jgi:eukaryotic-like serine/threonine-protein kinase
VSAATERIIGRYALHAELASGGMATVHLGRLIGSVGFSRAVAIKRMHAFLASDPEFVAMFVDEARLAGRIRHPNVVPTLDVVASDGELFLVMEYVLGESLNRVLAVNKAAGARIPLDVVSAIAIGLLEGLHAAHEAKDERGEPLHIVHRDVSPHNVLIGNDGVARVLDFGVAKAVGRMQTTQDGSLRGKVAYMSPEQLSNVEVDRRSDVWASGVVLWEMLTNARLFTSDSPGGLVHVVLTKEVPPPSTVSTCSSTVDAIVAKALQHDPEHRFATTREMAAALEAALPPASPRTVAEWLDGAVGADLRARQAHLEMMERDTEPRRPSTGTVRTRLAALGFGSPKGGAHASTPESSEATEAAGGRVVQRSTAPPAIVSAPAKRRPVAIALLVLAIALAVGMVARTLGRRRTAPVEPVAAASVTPPPAPSLDAAPPPSVESAPLAAPSVLPTATAVPRHRPPTPGARPATSKASAPLAGCDPPWTIGPAPDFIKRPKLECLPP